MELQRSFVTLPTRVWPARSRHYGYGHGSGRPDLGDLVPAGFPLPWQPVYDGMGEFVPGGYSLPQSPVYFPSAAGSLPKAPDIPMALIAHGNGTMECECGGSCDACGGMGALMVGGTDLETLIPGQTFGISNTYLAAGLVAAVLLFGMAGGGRRGRR